MPVYEYRCSKGHAYEKTEGFSAPVTQKCTKCSARARRQISMPSVIFKGSGFYSTDNRATAPSSSSSSSDGAKDSTSSDNGKSATKSDKASSTDSASKTEASVD